VGVIILREKSGQSSGKISSELARTLLHAELHNTMDGAYCCEIHSVASVPEFEFISTSSSVI
jgi:hypothetical protein